MLDCAAETIGARDGAPRRERCEDEVSDVASPTSSEDTTGSGSSESTTGDAATAGDGSTTG